MCMHALLACVVMVICGDVVGAVLLNKIFQQFFGGFMTFESITMLCIVTDIKTL